MATLAQIDSARPIMLLPYQHHLDQAATLPVDGLDYIKLEGNDVKLFLEWADRWKKDLEPDMQSISQDEEGRALLTTWMPLVTFRERFCGGGRQIQESAMQELMDRLRVATRPWRGHGVDTVDVVSYRREGNN